MSVSLKTGDLPEVSFDKPISILVPRIEERDTVEGKIFVAHLPFFGFLAYGSTAAEAVDRLGKMLSMMFGSISTNVLSGRLSFEDVSEGWDEYDTAFQTWVNSVKESVHWEPPTN